MTPGTSTSDTLARVRRRPGRRAAAASVEAHLTPCADCRAQLAPAGRRRPARRRSGTRSTTGWSAPRPGSIERLLRRVGVGEDTARLLAATPSLTASWLGALAARAGVRRRSPPTRRPTALLAVPHAGADAAGRGRRRGVRPAADPAHELARRRAVLAAPAAAAPRGGRRRRPRCVLAVLARRCSCPSEGWTAAAWLLPALALTSLTLALSAPRRRRSWAAAARAAALGRSVARRPCAPATATARRVRRRRPARVPRRRRRRGRRRRRASDRSRPRLGGALHDRRSSRRRRHQVASAAPGRSTASRSAPAPASPACSARTAPARPRCCGSSPPCSRRDAGAVRLLGPRPGDAGDRLAIRRRLGYLPQEPGFHRDFTVVRVRRLRRHPQGADRPRAPATTRCAGCSTLVGLDDVARPPDPGALRRDAAPGRRSPRPCSATPSCSSSTSRPPASTPSSGCGSASWSPGSARTARWSSRRTRPRTSPRSASTSSCSTAAGALFAGTPRPADRDRARPGLARRRARAAGASWPGAPADGRRRATSATRRPAPTRSSRRSRTATCCCVGDGARRAVAA